MLFSKFTFGSYVSSWTCEIRDGAETGDLITPGYFEEKQEVYGLSPLVHGWNSVVSFHTRGKMGTKL